MILTRGARAAENPDVLVVGAGPAGSTVGGLLAAGGWRVLVVDRARFPRPKPCGECLNPGAVVTLGRLGLHDRIAALGPAHLDGWTLRGAGFEASAGFGPGLYGFGVARADLDAALLDAARGRGVEVLEGTRVERVAAAAAAARPDVTLRAVGDDEARTLRPRVVVGADGLRSVVSRTLGLVRRRPRLRKVSQTFHLRTGPRGPTGAERSPWKGLLDTRDGVTLGLAPVAADGTRWNATVVADARRYGRRMGDDSVDFCMAVVRARIGDGGVDIDAGPWSSGPFDWPVSRCWAPGVVLVGDAAGYYDPFTGQGIYRALRSAEMAAEAVERVLATPEPSWEPLRRYSAAWKREIRTSVWVQRGVETVMAHRTLSRPVLRRLRSSGGLGRVIRVTGDAEAPSTLLDPRVWF